MIVKLIIAISDNGVIGYKEPVYGKMIPWRLKRDMIYFKNQTTGHIVVMGRKTADTFPKALPKRENIVLTRNPLFRREGFQVMNTKNQVLNHAWDAGENLWVIGGTQIYNLFSFEVKEIHLTRVHTKIPITDNVVLGPNLNFDLLGCPSGFELKYEPEKFEADADNEYPATYYVFKRIVKYK